MSDWNPEKYLLFKQQRTQPAVDLAVRVRELSPQSVVDIGCGPGNSTAVLRSVFPAAALLGIDSSETMITKARREHPDLTFSVCDAEHLTRTHDLLFSNACLQWIPHHETLIPSLMEHLNPDGALAVQIPMNDREPLLGIIREVDADPRWGLSSATLERNNVLPPAAYYGILSRCSRGFDLWETVYYHPLPSHEHLLEWVRSTRLRPYLEVLNDEDKPLFEQEILCRARRAYAPTATGEVILNFRRFFFVARK